MSRQLTISALLSAALMIGFVVASNIGGANGANNSPWVELKIHSMPLSAWAY